MAEKRAGKRWMKGRIRSVRGLALLLGLCLLLQPACAVWADGSGETAEEVLEEANSTAFQDGGLNVGSWPEYWEEQASDGDEVQLFVSDSVLQELEKRLCSAWENWETGQIAVEDLKIKEDEISDAFSTVRNRHPEYFYVEGSFTYKKRNNSSIVTSILCAYSNEYTDADVAFFQDKVDYILSRIIRPGMSEVEMVMAIHDYIVLNAAYDYDNYNDKTIPDVSYTAYGILVKGVGVCQGYAMAAGALMNRVGIENYYASSKEMNHGWNLVELNGNWYHMDATWDDPVPDRVGRLHHTYLLLSDATISQPLGGSTRPHSGWKSGGIVCSDTEYESGYLFSGAGQADYTVKDGTYWLLKQDSTSTKKRFRFLKYGSELKSPQILAESLAEEDICFDGRNYYYIQTNELLRADTETGIIETIYTAPEEIYEIEYRADEKAVRYELKSDRDTLSRSLDVSSYENEFVYEFGYAAAASNGDTVVALHMENSSNSAEAPRIYAAGYNDKGRLISLMEVNPQWQGDAAMDKWALIRPEEYTANRVTTLKLISVDSKGSPRAAIRAY